MSITFGTINRPKQDNYTVEIRAVVRRDNERQAKIISSVKICFQIRQTEQFIQAEYPPIYIVIKSGEKRVIPFGPSGASLRRLSAHDRIRTL